MTARYPRHVCSFIGLLIGLAIGAEAQAGVFVLPANPGAGDTVTILSDDPGAMRWGVNGWRGPAAGDLPPGTIRVGGVVETPLRPVGSRFQAQVGPFKNGVVYELNFAIRTAAGVWLKPAQGGDFKVNIAGPNNHNKEITIGQGAFIGETAGQRFFEEFQDWRPEDVRALDGFDDGRRYHDGGDASRDLVALYSRRENDQLFLRADVLDLAFGHDTGVVQFLFLVDCANGGQTYLPDFIRGTTTHPWELAVLVYGPGRFKVLNNNWQVVASPQVNPQRWSGSYARSDLDAIELGFSLSLLRDRGWNGQGPVNLQAFTFKAGNNEVTDAVAEADIFDGQFSRALSETDRAGTAKYAAILHGNQAIKNSSGLDELLRNTHIRTPSGNATGYFRALQTHQIFSAPVNIHVSGTLTTSSEWAVDPQAFVDGPRFNDWIEYLVKTGNAALIGGVFAEHIAPYFEGSGVNEASVRVNHEVLDAVFSTHTPRIYWTPERVIRGRTFDDILSSGYDWTVIDQYNHIRQWYGAQSAFSRDGFKVQRINGVQCFVINDQDDQKKFANTDDGTWINTRRRLLDKAQDGDQEQLTLVFDDWEAYAGRSFTSFGVGSDNPDNYNRHVRWLANHPWIQLVTLEQVASWGWTPVERGDNSNLSLQSYHWLQHANETSYDNWYYGSHLEESFFNRVPSLRPGQQANKKYGDVWTPNTLFHDAWQAVVNAPKGELKDLAEAAYTAAIFETAWHDEDNGNYHARDNNDNYLDPDTTYNNTSGWAIGMHNKTRDAIVIAAAAAWAASNPSSASQSRLVDIDDDGEVEAVLSNDRVFLVFENDGGRLILGFARDPQSGAASSLLGSPVVDPGAIQDGELEGDLRVSVLKDRWSTGVGGRYVNAPYRFELFNEGLRLISDDNRIRKTAVLRAGSDRLEITYEIDGSLGTLYVHNGISPDINELLKRGQTILRGFRDAAGYHLVTEVNGKRSEVIVEGNTNENPLDGFRNNGRGSALTHNVEVAGQGRFSFALRLRVNR